MQAVQETHLGLHNTQPPGRDQCSLPETPDGLWVRRATPLLLYISFFACYLLEGMQAGKTSLCLRHHPQVVHRAHPNPLFVWGLCTPPPHCRRTELCFLPNSPDTRPPTCHASPTAQHSGSEERTPLSPCFWTYTLLWTYAIKQRQSSACVTTADLATTTTMVHGMPAATAANYLLLICSIWNTSSSRFRRRRTLRAVCCHSSSNRHRCCQTKAAAAAAAAAAALRLVQSSSCGCCCIDCIDCIAAAAAVSALLHCAAAAA